MTRDELINRKSELEDRRQALVDQLTDVDTQSATFSAAGGSKSFTNRSVSDLKAKIRFVDKEIARIEFRLGHGQSPDRIRSIYPRYH